MLFVSVGFCVGAMFYSLELLHCLKEQSFFIPIQISGAVCMFGFLMVANCDHNLFKRAWHQMFPVCHEKQSFNIVAELLDDKYANFPKVVVLPTPLTPTNNQTFSFPF